MSIRVSELSTNVKLAAVPQHVVVLTPDNFDEIVLDQNKDVLVEFVLELVAESEDDKKAILGRIEEEANNLKGSSATYGKVYAKLANKYIEKGSDYANKEVERLGRVLDKAIGSVFTIKASNVNSKDSPTLRWRSACLTPSGSGNDRVVGGRWRGGVSVVSPTRVKTWPLRFP
ncbi:unnamed protein product [Cochlearia groenlandica]